MTLRQYCNIFAIAAVAAILLLLWAPERSGAEASRDLPGVDAGPPVVVNRTSTLPVEAGIVSRQHFYSAALGRVMPYALYLPPGYDGRERYPVLYMLHGRGGSFQQWVDYGLASEADHLIRAGVIDPLIIVMPEGENGYWVDHANNGAKWGTYVAEDLVNEVDTQFRTIAAARARAIGGNSMGGHGALQLALNHRDEFSIVGADSVALRSFDIAPSFFGDAAAYSDRDPVSICKKAPERARRLTLWIDIGASDEWASRAMAFHEQLVSEGVAHKWTVWPGAHDAQYWRSHVGDYLRFYDGALRDHDADQLATSHQRTSPSS